MFFNSETAMAYNIVISYTCTIKIESLTFTVKSSKPLPQQLEKWKVFARRFFFTES